MKEKNPSLYYSVCLFIFLGFSFLTSCSNETKEVFSSSPPLKGEYIYRHHDEYLFRLVPPEIVEREPYQWEMGSGPIGGYPRITKDFFRCKGSGLNPARVIQKDKESLRIYDCGGSQRHGLPLRDQNEFVYPILIKLLNYLQNKIGKRVVITCGHCCPEHYTYLDPLSSHSTSKHMMGAEVDFYMQGMENRPEKVVEAILGYYKENKENKEYQGLKEFEEFKRYEKDDTQVSTKPWYNKEIFVKIFKKNEGRDFDNRHPYPYVSIQVRYDTQLKENVSYSWDKAFRNYHRW